MLISGQAKSATKSLGVHIFWKSGPELKTALLAVTSYAPPKVEDKAVSEWLLEYVLTVIKWYGVETVCVTSVYTVGAPSLYVLIFTRCSYTIWHEIYLYFLVAPTSFVM